MGFSRGKMCGLRAAPPLELKLELGRVARTMDDIHTCMSRRLGPLALSVAAPAETLSCRRGLES
jgi:hypothetical protein